MIILLPEGDEDVVPEWNRHVARADDAYWASSMRRPFSWQRFLNWWAARRWVMPRDIRRS